ncbi:MAG TPA: leucine/isoleucine/valine transporter permease subunit, partial [Acidimicrobiia bacterium]
GVVLTVLPWIVNTFISEVLGTIGLYILLGLGLNIVVGYAGLLDLGYVAFFAVGAYSIAVLTANTSFLVGGSVTAPAEAGFMNFWVALPITIIIAVVIGVLIGAPVLRLRGDYLAIVTLGFGEIIRTLVLSDWLKPYLGGPQGITQIPPVPLGPLDTRDPRILYYLILAFVVISFFIATRLKYSRVGRAWAAMREDEDVAEGMGISVVLYKILAFVMGAAIGCLGGAFFAAKLSVANPGSFTLLVSINVLAVVVLGGMGSIPGVVVGSLVLVGLPELLREFGEYRLHIYGVILVAIMLLKPEGLIPDARRAKELHHKDEEPITDVPHVAIAGAHE